MPVTRRKEDGKDQPEIDPLGEAWRQRRPHKGVPTAQKKGEQGGDQDAENDKLNLQGDVGPNPGDRRKDDGHDRVASKRAS